MIDIHCHLLYGVDDGSKSLEESVEMLKIAKKQGVKGIILTPHLRHGMFKHQLDKIERHYKKLLPYAKKLGIDLKLGTEYHVATDMIDDFQEGRCHTLADTQYILTEYSHSSEWSFVHKMTREAIFAGYIPVVAHVERYECMASNIENVRTIRNMGADIQINASSVTGGGGKNVKKFVHSLLKEQLVDYIGTDAHRCEGSRVPNIRECSNILYKKYDEKYIDSILYGNAMDRIIQ